MMANEHCSVPLCTNDERYESGRSLTFFSFPTNGDLRKNWLIAIRRDEGALFNVNCLRFLLQ